MKEATLKKKVDKIILSLQKYNEERKYSKVAVWSLKLNDLAGNYCFDKVVLKNEQYFDKQNAPKKIKKRLDSSARSPYGFAFNN